MNILGNMFIDFLPEKINEKTKTILMSVKYKATAKAQLISAQRLETEANSEPVSVQR